MRYKNKKDPSISAKELQFYEPFRVKKGFSFDGIYSTIFYIYIIL